MVAAVSATGQLVLVGLSSSQGGVSLSGSGTLGFPVTGIWNAEITTTTTSYLQGLAPYNFITFINWLGSQQQSGQTSASLMQAVKNYAAGIGNELCKTGVYNLWNAWFPSAADAGFFDHARLAALNLDPYWWLVSNYPGTTQVTSQDGLPKVATNVTNTTPTLNVTSVGSVTGPGNVNAVQMLAWLIYQQQIAGNANALNASDPVTAANPFIDYVLSDNQEQTPYVSGCWLTTPTVYTSGAGNNNAALNGPVAAGYAQFAAELRSLDPSLQIGGNCDNFVYGSNAIYPASVQSLYDLPLVENPFGRFENNQGSNFNTLLATFAAFEAMLNVKPGNYVLGLTEEPSFTTSWTSSNQASWTAADWQAFRYQAAVFGLMRWAHVIGISTSTVWKFDEFLGGTTYNKQNWGGAPVGSRSLTPWVATGVYGIYRADFANMAWFISPKGNGAVSFTCPFNGHRLATLGFGSASVNNGAAVTTSTVISLSDRDAICLRKS